MQLQYGPRLREVDGGGRTIRRTVTSRPFALPPLNEEPFKIVGIIASPLFVDNLHVLHSLTYQLERHGKRISGAGTLQ
jgi:hypothetical protein